MPLSSGELFRFKAARRADESRLDAARAMLAALPDKAAEERPAEGYYYLHGLTWVVEVPKGGTRKGRKTTLAYGHIKGTEGTDGDCVDFWMEPDNLGCELFFVVNQEAKGGGLDEHKVMVGFTSEEAAREGYLANYPAGLGEKLLGGVRAMTLDEFKNWLWNSDKEKRAALDRLREAKARSDRGDMAGKRSVLRGLVKDTPGEWDVEDDGKTKYPGLTHRPTGFRIHATRDVASAAKSAAENLPYRDRAEMYALRDGNVFGSIYQDTGAFGVYGGGIDAGEDQAAAAAREFQEESGWSVSNPKLLPIAPMVHDWNPPYDSDKHRERAKKFRGSRTYYVVGDLGDQVPDSKIDELGRLDPRLYSLDEAIKLAPGAGLALSDVNSKRSEVLKYLKAMGAKTASDAAEITLKDGTKVDPRKLAKEMADKLRRSAGDSKESRLLHNLLCEFMEPFDDVSAEGKRPYTIGVDLDGTLAEQEEPFDPKSIGPPRPKAKYYLDAFRKAGARIIIFTVRGDESMVSSWLIRHDMPYDFINENPDQPADSSGKILADAYWDDRAFNARDLDEHGPSLIESAEDHRKEASDFHGPEQILEAAVAWRQN